MVPSPGLIPPAREVGQVIPLVLFFVEIHLWSTGVAQQTLNCCDELTHISFLGCTIQVVLGPSPSDH